MGGRAKLYHGRDCGKRLIRHDTDQPIDFAAALSKRTGVYLALTSNCSNGSIVPSGRLAHCAKLGPQQPVSRQYLPSSRIKSQKRLERTSTSWALTGCVVRRPTLAGVTRRARTSPTRLRLLALLSLARTQLLVISLWSNSGRTAAPVPEVVTIAYVQLQR